MEKIKEKDELIFLGRERGGKEETIPPPIQSNVRNRHGN